MKNILLFALLAAGLAACGRKNEATAHYSDRRAEMEERGEECLSRARTLLAAREYSAARRQIDSMRRTYPLALNAREAGILLLDSLCLAEAQDSLAEVDSLLLAGGLPEGESRRGQAVYDELCQKVKFYKRKLYHDRKNKQRH